MWSAIPGENLGDEGGNFEELGTKAVQFARNPGKGLIFLWEQRFWVILSRRGY